jgi:hypothetical protein
MNANESIANNLFLSHLQAIKKARRVANATDKLLLDLQSEIITGIMRVNSRRKATEFELKNLNSLLAETSRIINEKFFKIQSQFERDIGFWIGEQSAEIIEIINAGIGADIATGVLPKSIVKRLSQNIIVEGTPSKAFWDKQSADLKVNFERQMRLGIANGETIGEITNRIRGGDIRGIEVSGIMNISRSKAAALARTSTGQVYADVRRETFKENSDVISAIQQVSTLDKRTTNICKKYDLKSWSLPDYEPIGHTLKYGTGVPRHFQCRSSEVPIIKSYSDLSEEKKAKVPKGRRTSIDGIINDDIDYETFLKEKSESFQNEVLGKSTAESWRNGSINFDEIV